MSHTMTSDAITTKDVAPSSGLEINDANESIKKNGRAGESSNGMDAVKEKSMDRSGNGGSNGVSSKESSSTTTAVKMTAEEEKLRKRLHAKREEERLRDIIKRKKESFRNNYHGSNIENSNHSKDGNPVESKEEKKMESVSGKRTTENSTETKKADGTTDRASSRDERVAPRDPNRRTDPQERRNGAPHEIGRRDRPRRRDRRHRHADRRPPYRHHPPPHFREDWRGHPPPRGDPYGPHYDPRRPPYRGRGEEPRSFRGDNDGDIDPFGRRRRSLPDSAASRGSRYSSNDDDRRHGKRRRSRSRSSDSRTSDSVSTSSCSRSSDASSRRRKRRRSRSSSSERSKHSESYSSSGSRSSSSSSTASRKSEDDKDLEEESLVYSKDQRTVFVTQLVMRTTIKDIKKFFKEQDIRVNEIELLRDRHSGQHKGSAYVELKRMIDVAKAVNLSGQAPTFQRFPIMIKALEAERNYVQPLTTLPLTAMDPSTVSPAAANVVAALQQQLQQQALKVKLPPLKDESGQLIQAQKVYVGNLEVNSVTSQHLQVLFAPFGTLTEIQLQHGKGFAFLQYHDPKEAALAIQTMSGQVLAGRPMKTGWATNPIVSINGVAVVTSNEFPPDAAARVQNAYQILAQLTSVSFMTQVIPPHLPLASGSLLPSAPLVASTVPTVADARASLAAVAAANSAKIYSSVASVPTIAVSSIGSVPDPMVIGNADHPSQHLLVHNMFNKDEETENGWENELREEFIEECSKYGTIVNVIVISREVGGKIYASFNDAAGAQTCARSLAGRWFDRKQLRVEFTTEEQVHLVEKQYPSISTEASTSTIA